jgi:hypothetical protein
MPEFAIISRARAPASLAKPSLSTVPPREGRLVSLGLPSAFSPDGCSLRSILPIRHRRSSSRRLRSPHNATQRNAQRTQRERIKRSARRGSARCLSARRARRSPSQPASARLPAALGAANFFLVLAPQPLVVVGDELVVVGRAVKLRARAPVKATRGGRGNGDGKDGGNGGEWGVRGRTGVWV